jgi:hypothetical protein
MDLAPDGRRFLIEPEVDPAPPRESGRVILARRDAPSQLVEEVHQERHTGGLRAKSLDVIAHDSVERTVRGSRDS